MAQTKTELPFNFMQSYFNGKAKEENAIRTAISYF